MERLTCKQCGGTLKKLAAGGYECVYCGSYYPEEEGTPKLAEAYALIRKGEFSEAEALCSGLIAADERNAEAYWVRALAKSGVIFVKDIGDKMVPTCQCITKNSFVEDEDVRKAISCASPVLRENYEKQAKRIEEIRREWFLQASKEKPYDVFISYKDSDKEHGVARTKDSEYAHSLYNYLQGKGLRVFFSRVSLMDKVSDHYEPYIYNALMTAKVMVVYGEQAEYFNSTWIRNEWSRFILRIGRENLPAGSLIVAYKGVDPYRIPSALLGGRQGIDVSDPAAFQILVEKITSTVERAKKPVTLERKEIEGGKVGKRAKKIGQEELRTRTVGANAPVKLNFSLESKLKMVRRYLAQGLWEDASDSLNAVLEEAPDNGEALLSKLLIRMGRQRVEDLVTIPKFTEYPLLRRILENSDRSTAEPLLSALCATSKIRGEEKAALLKELLPYDYPSRKRDIEQLFQRSISEADTAVFDVLLQTLGEGEVDRYIELNIGMYESLMRAGKRAAAEKYAKNVFSVDEGNEYFMRKDCENALGTSGFLPKFENLLRYSSDTDGCVVHFIRKILEDEKVTKEEAGTLKEILRYYKQSFLTLKELLLSVVKCLIGVGCFTDAEYFNNLILQEDDHCAEGWLNLCLIGTKSASPDHITESDIPLNKCRGFDEYCNLADEKKLDEIFKIVKRQKDAIAERRERERLWQAEQTKKKKAKRRKTIGALLGVLFVAGIIAVAIGVPIAQEKKKYLNGLKYLDMGEGYAVTGLHDGGKKKIVVPDTYNGKPVIRINSCAFQYCYNITSVTIGKNVQEIGSSAFYNCSSLASVTIGDSVKEIGGSAFYCCSSLASVTIGDSVTEIKSRTFYCCSSLTDVTIGKNVKKIGESAFNSCSSLTSITIGKSVTEIESYAFIHCPALTSAKFELIAMWSVTSYSNPKVLGSTEIGNPSTAAEYLKDKYCYCTWTRK